MSDSSLIWFSGFEFGKRWGGFAAEGRREKWRGNVFLIAVAVCSCPDLSEIFEFSLV